MDMLAVVSEIREEVVTAAKKVAVVATAAGAEGMWAVVSAAAKVAMVLADNSGNGRAGNGGGNSLTKAIIGSKKFTFLEDRDYSKINLVDLIMSLDPLSTFRSTF